MSLLFSVIIHVNHVKGVDVAGDPAQERQDDVDEEIGAATCDGESTYWWDWALSLIGIKGDKRGHTYQS